MLKTKTTKDKDKRFFKPGEKLNKLDVKLMKLRRKWTKFIKLNKYLIRLVKSLLMRVKNND